MKKLLLLFVCLCSGAAMAQITSSYLPTYGCPNTTHDLTVSVTNNQTVVPTTNTTFSVSLTVKDNLGNTLKSFTSSTFSSGWALGETKNLIITSIPFAGAMTCTVEGTIGGTTISTMVGPPPTFTPIPFPIPFSYTIPTQNYVVKYPPTLTITNSSNDLSVTTPLDGYSVQYFVNGSTFVFQSNTTGDYTAPATGSYTAKGYDIASSCISQNASNAISLTITALEEARGITISVYPNPVISSVTIESGSSVIYTYELSDLNGKIVRSNSFQKISNVNMEDLKSGSYVLSVKDGETKVGLYRLVK